MAKTYYSSFFPDPEYSGAKGTTIPIITTGGVDDILEEIDDIKELLPTFVPIDNDAPLTVTGLVLNTILQLDSDGSQIITLVATWNASAASDLNHYDLAIQENGGGFVEFTAGSTATRYIWTVRANQTFGVKIRAVDHAGNLGPYSTVVNLVSAKDNVAPAAPTGLATSPGFNVAFIRWNNPADLDLTNVVVYGNTTNNSATATILATVNAIPSTVGGFTHSAIPTGATVYYWVKAVDSSGNYSPFSAVATAATITINEGDFATGLELNRVGPALPNPVGYTGSKLFYNTTDKRLYRYNSAVPNWTKAVDAGDVTGKIVNTQIADNAIDTPQLNANAVTAAKIAGKTITADEIEAGTIVGSLIAGTTITGDKISGRTIAATKLIAGDITANEIKSETLVGGLFKTDTSLPGTITVGTTGVTIGTVKTQAENPAAVINTKTTTIDPGRILISGATTLSDWRSGTDNTLIKGGALEANSVTANKMYIGSRNVQVIDVTFDTNRVNQVTWTAGAIVYIGDDGSLTTTNISSGSSGWSAGQTISISWTKGATVLSATAGTPSTSNNVMHLAQYRGGTNLIANYGKTIIDGTSIKTGTIDAVKITANSITSTQLSTTNLITNSAQIADAVITNAKIGNLEVNTIKIAGGAITSNQVVTAPDKYVASGATEIALLTGAISIGDTTYGSGLISVNFTIDATLGSDTSGLFRLYTTVDGAGWVLNKSIVLGVTTNNGSTYSRICGTLNTIVSGYQTAFYLECLSGTYTPAASTRPFWVRDITAVILGTKR